MRLKNNVLHVSHLRTQKVGGVEKIKSDGLAVGRNRSDHARLISSVAIMGHEQATAVEMKHSYRIVGPSSPRHLIHERGTHGSHAKRDLRRLAFHGAFPGTGQSFQFVEGLLRVGLGESHGRAPSEHKTKRFHDHSPYSLSFFTFGSAFRSRTPVRAITLINPW